jgi:hypothetical protein
MEIYYNASSFSSEKIRDWDGVAYAPDLLRIKFANANLALISNRSTASESPYPR